jgi:hypothetical protein
MEVGQGPNVGCSAKGKKKEKQNTKKKKSKDLGWQGTLKNAVTNFNANHNDKKALILILIEILSIKEL